MRNTLALVTHKRAMGQIPGRAKLMKHFALQLVCPLDCTGFSGLISIYRCLTGKQMFPDSHAATHCHCCL